MATQQILEILYKEPSTRNLSKDAVEAIDYNQIMSDPILFDKMLRDEAKRNKKAKCSEIFGFTTRTLTAEECTKFQIDSSKNYQIIINIEPGSIASINGLKIGDILIGMYNNYIGTRPVIYDFVDEDALYNLNGNSRYNDRTMLYIHFRVLRYVYRTIFDFNLNYVNIDILPLKPLTHTNRFALPYIRINDNNTIINFGSVYFEKYIDGLTDSTQQMGGGKGMWSWLGGPASSAEAETEAEEPGTKAEEPGTVSSFQDLVKEITQLIQREKKMKVGVDKIRLQETILQYSYLHRENLNQRLTRELQKQQQHQQLNESKLKLIKNKIK